MDNVKEMQIRFHATTNELSRQISHLSAMCANLSGDCGFLQERNKELEQDLAQANEQIPDEATSEE